MKANICIFRASKWNIAEDGKSGLKLDYISEDQREDSESSLGFSTFASSVPLDQFSKLQAVPAVYEVEMILKARRGAGGKQLQSLEVASINKMVKEVKLF